MEGRDHPRLEGTLHVDENYRILRVFFFVFNKVIIVKICLSWVSLGRLFFNKSDKF